MITFSGLASGLDTDSIVSSLVNLERQPIARLESQNSSLNAQRNVLNGLSSALSTLNSRAKDLDTVSEFLSYTASSSNTSAVEVTASGTSVPGSYRVEVTQLAQAQRTYSSTFGSRTDALSGSDQTLSLTIDGTTTDITVAAGSSLEDVVAAINNSGADASAGLFFDGANYRLQVVGKSTGADNAISFADTGLGLGLSDPGNTVQAAQNAIAEIDGFEVTSATNVLADALPGTTLTLKAETSAPVDVGVAADQSGVKAKIQAFVDAYNEVFKVVNAQSGEGLGTNTLSGDSTVRTIETSLQRLISGPIGGLTDGSGNSLVLADLGVKTNRDGTLTLDTADLDEALTADFSRAARYFAGDGSESGMSGLIGELIEGYITGSESLIEARKSGIQTQIDGNDDRIESLELYIERFETNLRTQFTLLETTISQLNSQGAALAQIL
jgi:flagellar hook-associated protein 2